MADTWTAERTKSLIHLWAEGYSARRIAEKLELRSRSAVIGKVRRLDLPTPAKKLANSARITQVRKRREAFAAISRPAGSLSEHALHLNLSELEPRHCRFPYGDGPFTFCGHPKLANTSYCESHVAFCFEVQG